MKQLSTHAAAAKAIRSELKKLGIKAKVRSESFAGGNAVNIEIEDASPSLYSQVEKVANKYQSGHFDSMNDIYEYSNVNDDIPQVKYVSVTRYFSEELKQRAYDVVKALPTEGLGLGEFHENYMDANHEQKMFTLRVIRGADCSNYFSKHLWSEEELGPIHPYNNLAA